MLKVGRIPQAWKMIITNTDRNSYVNVTGDILLSLFIHRFLYYRRKPDVAQGLPLEVAAKPVRHDN